MNIKNTSSRIINIGTTILRPDDTMPTTDQLVATPAIKAMVEKGWLTIEDALENSSGSKSGGSSRKNSSSKGVGGKKSSKSIGGKSDSDTENSYKSTEDSDKDGEAPGENNNESSTEQ